MERNIPWTNKCGLGSRFYCGIISLLQDQPEAECGAGGISQHKKCVTNRGYSLHTQQPRHGFNRGLKSYQPADVNNPPAYEYQQDPGGKNQKSFQDKFNTSKTIPRREKRND